MPDMRELTTNRTVTSVRPSRIVWLLSDKTPGIEPIYQETVTRRVVFPSGSPLVLALEQAGYETETDPAGNQTVSFPINRAVSSESAPE